MLMNPHTKQGLTSLKSASGAHPCYGVGANLTSKKNIKELFKKHRVYPSKKFGQNFLIDKTIIKKVIKAANLKPKDVVLEIGPGIGSLTQELAKKVKKVIAAEKDSKMVEILKETLKSFKNVEVLNQDILKTDVSRFKIKDLRFKVVANLPFYITAPVIRKFLESEHPPVEMVLITQKEVAQRICSRPPKMNLLAVSVQFYAKVKIISYVSKKSFWPQPKVDGAILKIVPHKIPKAAFGISRRLPLEKRFFRIVKAGFSQPRKQLANNLTKGLALSSPNGLALSSPNGLKLNKEQIKFWLLENNIQPSQRAETLEIKDWINLAKTFK